METATPQNRFPLRFVQADRLIDLRWRILRKGLARDAARIDGDDDPRTLHVAIFDLKLSNRDPVCGATFMDIPFEHREGWRLRGIATDVEYQRRGLGTRLLTEARPHLANASGFRLVWYTAPEAVIPFYEKLGWRPVGDIYNVNGTPHQKMLWDI